MKSRTPKASRNAWDLIDDPGLDRAKVTVENTETTVSEKPIMSLVLGTPTGVYASERRAQAQVVESDVIPAEIQSPYVDGQLKVGYGVDILRAWGFTLGKPVDGDPLFIHVTLPPGWKKKGSSHAMWSSIVDEQGRERCSIFFKGAFYDRSAHLSISPRYQVSTENENPSDHKKSRVRGIVKEGETVLFTGEWHKPDSVKYWEAGDTARTEAATWFKANRPTGIVEQWAF
jgi:hypothetical protein